MNPKFDKNIFTRSVYYFIKVPRRLLKLLDRRKTNYDRFTKKYLPYKGYHSGSDITLGDFWGAQDLLPDFYDYYGNSVVIINSVQGRELFEQIKHNLHIKEISENDVLTENSGLITPFPMSSDRESYFKNSMKHGYIKPLEKYVHSTLFRRIYAKSIRIIPHRKKI